MQPQNSPIDIAKVISDADRLISKINAYLEEMENKYHVNEFNMTDSLVVKAA